MPEKKAKFPKVSVFVGASVDGYIAKKNDGLEWLEMVNVEGEDYGFAQFMSTVDVLVMGRRTYDIVRGFPEWPYQNKKVIVLTHRPFTPVHNESQASGSLSQILEDLALQGIQRVYLDGGQVIQAGLKEKVVSDLTISVIPILLGDGIPLFGYLNSSLVLKTESVQKFSSGLIQLKYQVPMV